MLRKATIGLTTLAVATTTAIAPAMADDTTPKETTAVETTTAANNSSSNQDATKHEKHEKTFSEKLQQAEVTAKRLDNAKKGIEVTKTIVEIGLKIGDFLFPLAA